MCTEKRSVKESQKKFKMMRKYKTLKRHVKVNWRKAPESVRKIKKEIKGKGQLQKMIRKLKAKYKN